MNLEWEDCLFLCKVEKVLLVIVIGWVVVKKLIKDKIYYCWLCFNFDVMIEVEVGMDFGDGECGVWLVLLEVEFCLFDYYEFVFGLFDMLKVKVFSFVCEKFMVKVVVFGNIKVYDFQVFLIVLKVEDSSNCWKYLCEVDVSDCIYFLFKVDGVVEFCSEVYCDIQVVICSMFFFLVEIDKFEFFDDQNWGSGFVEDYVLLF